LAHDGNGKAEGRKKVLNMSATGIVLAITAWLALQVPLGMIVGHCIRRTVTVAIRRPDARTKPRPFVGHPSALLRG
jgi:hypothetical protein